MFAGAALSRRIEYPLCAHYCHSFLMVNCLIPDIHAGSITRVQVRHHCNDKRTKLWRTTAMRRVALSKFKRAENYFLARQVGLVGWKAKPELNQHPALPRKPPRLHG
jgi:hypothetical protein